MRRAVVAGLVVLSPFLASCDEAGRRSGAGDGETLSVVASFYPVFEAARAVGGERARVVNLTPAGTEPHDLELEPDQVDQVEDADVVLYLGGGFQPAVEDVAERTDGAALDVLGVVDVEGEDPHVWLDPIRFAEITAEIGEMLAAADPGGAADFSRNAEAYAQRLRDLDAEIRTGLQGCARKRIVTSHDAFGYLASRYDLTQESIAGVSAESEPDPKRLAELADSVRRDGTTTIFAETLVSPRVAEALAREAGVATAVLDPLEGLSPAQQRAGETYFTVMRKNLAALRAALACP